MPQAGLLAVQTYTETPTCILMNHPVFDDLTHSRVSTQEVQVDRMRCLHTDHMWDGVLAPCHVTRFQRTFTPTKGFAEGREADGKSNGMR